MSPFLCSLRALRSPVPRSTRLAAGALVTGIAALVVAPAPSAAQWRLDVAARDTARGPDTLACPDCAPRRRHPATATGEAAAALVVPWAWNSLHGKAFARVSPATWWDNITGRWVWDDNSFRINQWGHPYQGSLYFNAARTNGYGFWSSAAVAWIGAYLWECCAETHPGSPNDLVNTALGGAALGEMFYRVSSLAIDNAATGRGRIAHEVVATLIDPMRGANRLARGQTRRPGSNAADARPDSLRGALEAGWIRLGAGGTTRDAAVVRLGMVYGDPVRDVPRSPFSYFTATADLTTLPHAEMFDVATRGSLAGITLHDGARATHVAGAMLSFAYFRNDVYEFGAQMVMAGVTSRWRPTQRVTLLTEAFVRAAVLGAVRSDAPAVAGGTAAPAATTTPSRDYDFGPGIGADLNVMLVAGDRAAVRLNYLPIAFFTVDGSASRHSVQTALAETRVRVTSRLALGGAYRLAYRRSVYPGGSARTLTVPEIRAFASTALPWWSH
jgi:hypothetical protein